MRLLLPRRDAETHFKAANRDSSLLLPFRRFPTADVHSAASYGHRPPRKLIPAAKTRPVLDTPTAFLPQPNPNGMWSTFPNDSSEGS